MDRSRIAIVIPALNEARSIHEIVKRAAERGVPLVVDDGSSDDTGSIASAAGAEVMRHEVNQGYDSALNTGFDRAAERHFEYAITLDADGQHDPTTLANLIAAFEAGADVVIGVRDRRQRFSEHLFAVWARWLWGIEDPLCGMKGYRMTAYDDHGCFDSCSSIGTELAICAAVRGFRIAQVPVPTRVRNGASRFGSALRANYRIMRALAAVTAKAFIVGREQGRRI